MVEIIVADLLYIRYNEVATLWQHFGNTLATENQYAKIKCANEVKYRQISNKT